MSQSRKVYTVRSTLIAVFLSAFLLALLAGRATAQPGAGGFPSFAPDRLIIQLSPSAVGGIDSVLVRHSIQSASPLFKGNSTLNGLDRIYRLDLPSGSDVQQSMQMLAKDPNIEWAEPDYLAYPISETPRTIADITPNDPLMNEEWGLSKIGAPAAWGMTTGSQMVAIAIIDSGIDMSHPDLAGKLWVNPAEVPGNGLDDDGHGFVDDVNGWDFVNNDNNPSDDEGHGTQVAGVVAAATNNALGIAGLCWNCRIMVVKVMQSSGVANYSDIAAGVEYAAELGAKVINLSLGGYSDSHVLHTAIQSAVNHYGSVVVGGAGNDNTSNRFYPAAYEEVLAAAGTDGNDVKSAISNYGSWVDITAPAVSITTTFMGGDYGAANGTSFAASFVSGLAGLVRSEHPTWTPALVEAQILHTTDLIDALNPGYAGLLGSGRINADAAVSESPRPILTIDSTEVNGDPLGRPAPGETASLQIILGNDWLDATGVQGVLSTSDAYVTVNTGTASFGSILSGGTGTGSPLYSFSVAPGAGYNHAILFNLHVTANGGVYHVDLPLTITTQSGNQNVGGTIGVDTTWTNDKTYIVINNVGVAPGVTLTIQAGTVVKFNGNYSLNLGGTLIADGTESQPIRFMSNTGRSWGRIYFDDTSLDAVTDISGTYQSGNILRWVSIESASQGIGCNKATPFIEHTTTDGGGISCVAGGTSLWVKDSDFSGDIQINEGEGVGTVQGKWVSRANMPTARRWLGVTAAPNGRIYAIGGYTGTGYLATVEEYDPTTDTWVTRASMHTARYNLGVTSAPNGRIYAIGGWNDAGGLSTVEEYDPSTDTWTTRANMPTARSLLGVTTAKNGKIYAIGGWNGSSTLSTVEEYDPTTDTWTTRASMPTARSQLGVTAAPNGKIYAIGGFNPLLATVEEYDPATDAWATRANMPTKCVQLGVAAIPNGKIYAIGGLCSDGINNNVKEYNPATDTWIYRASMPTGRSGLGVAIITSSKIYAIGGWNGYTDFSTVEEYTPPTDQYGYHFLNSIVRNGNLSLPGYSEVRASIINGNIDTGTRSTVQNVTSNGSITINGNGVIIGNTVGNTVSMGSGIVQNNTVSNGSIIIGSGQVLSNTVISGSISAIKYSVIYHNDVEHSPGYAIIQHFDGITPTGVITVTENRLVGNAEGIYTMGGLVQGNLIANISGVGLEIYSGGIGLGINGNTTVISNTFTAVGGSVVKIQDLTGLGDISGLRIEDNNFEFNTGAYDIENLNPKTILATIPASGNWWGTTDPSVIAERIFDYNDDYTKGTVQYAPIATGSIQSAPAYVRSVTVTPNPVGIETAIYEVLFSKEMDIAVFPEMLFGQSSWVIGYPQWLSSSHYRASYDITSLIPRDTYSLTVSGAAGTDGIEIAPNTAYTFTVDYAGGVGDTTPPPLPTVQACAASTLDILSASWSAFDPDSNITLYQYAIGTTLGGTDVVNWTTTSGISFTRSGLILIGGQTYYISVKARNAGGLWSPAASAGVVAGSGLCRASAYPVYLPVVKR